MLILLILDISNPLEIDAGYNNSLINKFCIATLKAKLNFKDKQKLGEISNFTCDCFFKKYKSGSTIKSSRIYCRKKAADKYNL
tara:strand:- start:364 stop:612 length:249 start_codon:yes stop_codon:yes gene_type:complete